MPNVLKNLFRPQILLQFLRVSEGEEVESNFFFVIHIVYSEVFKDVEFNADVNSEISIKKVTWNENFIFFKLTRLLEKENPITISKLYGMFSQIPVYLPNSIILYYK